jgi:hypothetical protein
MADEHNKDATMYEVTVPLNHHLHLIPDSKGAPATLQAMHKAFDRLTLSLLVLNSRRDYSEHRTVEILLEEARAVQKRLADMFGIEVEIPSQVLEMEKLNNERKK